MMEHYSGIKIVVFEDSRMLCWKVLADATLSEMIGIKHHVEDSCLHARVHTHIRMQERSRDAWILFFFFFLCALRFSKYSTMNMQDLHKHEKSDLDLEARLVTDNRTS